MPVTVHLLGRPRFVVGGHVYEPPPDRRSAMLYFLAHVRGWVPREDLLYLFWPDFEEHKARANLRQLLLAVRNAPYACGLEVERTRLRFTVATDLDAFDDHLTPRGSLAWPGQFLDGYRIKGAPEFDSWLELERAAWGERYREMLLVVAANPTDPPAAAANLETWLAHAPLDEEALRAWLRLAARLGRGSSALAQFVAFEARLRADVGVAPEPATLAVVEELYRESCGGLGVPVAKPTPVRGGWARRQRSGTFVGRDQELRRIADELVPRPGVVTLLAPGGMGKTRLALEAAERMEKHFVDGVVVVPLAEAHTPSDAAAAVAEALGLHAAPARSAPKLVQDALRGKRMLVVLDNLEQVNGIADMVEAWRDAATDASWLLTSRAIVGIRGESLIDVTGLPYPREGEEPTDDHAAVDLLVSRARTAGVELHPDRDATAIARVTQLCSGMPLAIELAAGWLRIMPLASIAAEIEAGLDLMVAAGGAEDPRHANLRSVFDAAWTALSEAEKAAMTRLTVFRRGFTEVAARDVADVDRPLLLALRNRSLLELDSSGRFGWHPLLGAYLRPRTDLDALEPIRERHARYFMELLARCEGAERRGDTGEAIATLAVEHANLEAAWVKAVEAGWWDLLGHAGTRYRLSYESVGRGDRWGEQLRHALASMTRRTVPWALLESHESSTLLSAGRFQEAYERRAAAVTVLRRFAESEPCPLGWGLLLLSEPAWSLDRPAEARTVIREAIDAFERAGRHDLLGLAYDTMLAVSESPRDHEHWYAKATEWRAQNREAPDEAVAITIRSRYLSRVYGEHDSAVATVDAALALDRGAGAHRARVAETLLTAAEIRADAGHLETAADHVEQYLRGSSPVLGSSLYPVAIRAGPGEPLALKAHLGMLRGDEDVEWSLGPTSAAACTHRGLLLRAETLRLRGSHSAARSCVDEALVRVQRERVGLDRAVWRSRALVAAAEVSLTERDAARAVAELHTAIAHAVGWHLLPSLLEAFTIACALLPPSFAGEVGEYVTGHYATGFNTRRRLGGPVDVTSVGSDRDDTWKRACSFAERVTTALEGAAARVVGAKASDARRRGPVN